jgi:hypothetical protein
MRTILDLYGVVLIAAGRLVLSCLDSSTGLYAAANRPGLLITTYQAAVRNCISSINQRITPLWVRKMSGPASARAAVAFQAPKYIQQAGALQRVGEFAKHAFPHAQKAGVLTSARLRSRYMEQMCKSVDSPVIAEFSGECSRSNLGIILQKMQGQQVDYIIGFGGGKLLDMAKLVGIVWLQSGYRCPDSLCGELAM